MSLEFDGKTQSVSEKANGGEFLSLASHELRTPLSITKWYLEMLLDGDCGPLNVDQVKYLKTIEASNQRAIDLIRSLLNVSRLDLDTFCVVPEDTDLRDIVKQLLTDHKIRLLDKSIQVTEKYEGATIGTPSLVSVDRKIATVLLRTLFENAVTFSHSDSTLEVHVFDGGQGSEIAGNKLLEDSVIFSIKDSGIGIPEDEKGKIFSKLFKATNAGETESAGAGLGLYIVKMIVEKVGGDVWFASVQNSGSTFYIAFSKHGMQKKEGRTTLD